jgi:carbon-monoxide dehydrogenase large subunit
MSAPPFYPLAVSRVRHVGDPIAFVVASDPQAASDAAELIDVQWRPLPVVAETTCAETGDLIWPEIPRNLCFDWDTGDADRVEQALKNSAYRVALTATDNRTVTCFMEPRAAIGRWDPDKGIYQLEAGVQSLTAMRDRLSDMLSADPSKVRIISRDVGGGFGSRNVIYGEYACLLFAAKSLRRSVRWTATREEEFRSTAQGRDYVLTGTLGLDRDGKFTALHVKGVCSMGAYNTGNAPFTALRNVTRMLAGVYTTPLMRLELKGVFTNTVPISSYRGVGRVEAIYILERLIDEAEKECGINRIVLRLKNLISKEQFPYKTPTGSIYDSGDYAENMRRAMEIADWENFSQRRLISKAQGKLRGIGLCNFIEGAGGDGSEFAALTISAEGKVELRTGCLSQGQGHETSMRQIVSEKLGITLENITMPESNSDVIGEGTGTNASRSIVRGGSALCETADIMIRKGLEIAAERLEASPQDIDYQNGVFSIKGTDRSISLFDMAHDNTLSVEHRHSNEAVTYPNGCQVCEVEVDPETGNLDILSFIAVDDVGRAINPMIVHGQSQGGIVQGIGQAVFEHTVYDRKTGQLISGSFLDYCLPRADNLPPIDPVSNDCPSPTNPLGVKGAGEGGTTGAPATLINAIMNALSQAGVTQIDMPVTPYRVWESIQTARGSRVISK